MSSHTKRHHIPVYVTVHHNTYADGEYLLACACLPIVEKLHTLQEFVVRAQQAVSGPLDTLRIL